jgi:aminopeptidase-like protein
MPSSEAEELGRAGHALATGLWPLCRSLTGGGTRETLARLQRELPGMQVHAVPSGTVAFDWTVPDEWNIRGAYIADGEGRRIVDFADSNLHVVGYSEPVDVELPLAELKAHLHSLPDQPDAIPYITSYYSRRWGFCLTHRQLQSLPEGTYRAVIDSDLAPGVLNYGELLVPGETSDEIFISTYVCHPSMANNELSGPVVATAIAKWVSGLPRRRHSFRFVFIPETIGSIVYLSRNLDALKGRVRAGFNVTCIGDERCYSYLPSRAGNTLSDRAALNALQHIDPSFRRYSWLDRGSDERQYCAPGVDLPVATIMRSKYGTYPEYHTSLDDLRLVTPSGLAGGIGALMDAIAAIEGNTVPTVTVKCEPQMGRRGLYPTLSTKQRLPSVADMMNVISYCDGTCDSLAIADIVGRPAKAVNDILALLAEQGLVQLVPA